MSTATLTFRATDTLLTNRGREDVTGIDGNWVITEHGRYLFDGHRLPPSVKLGFRETTIIYDRDKP